MHHRWQMKDTMTKRRRTTTMMKWRKEPFRVSSPRMMRRGMMESDDVGMTDEVEAEQGGKRRHDEGDCYHDVREIVAHQF